MGWIIVDMSNRTMLTIVCDEAGETLYFEESTEAEEYADENIQDWWVTKVD